MGACGAQMMRLSRLPPITNRLAILAQAVNLSARLFGRRLGRHDARLRFTAHGREALLGKAWAHCQSAPMASPAAWRT